MNKTFSYNNLSIAYKQKGQGPNVLLCFHGFGLTSDSFNYLEDALGEGYTYYAFDFFYHGETENPSNSFSNAFSSEVFSDIIYQFLTEKKILRFNIIAYSMGARLSLVLIQKMPDLIERIVFIAPDGIYDSFWFKFSTKTKVGLFLFKKFTNNPTPFFSLMNLTVSIGLIKAKKKKFAELNTGNLEKRKQVYNTWLLIENLVFDRTIIGQLIDANQLKFNIITGKYDSIIVKDKLLRWNWLKKNQEQLIIVNSGHAMKEKVLLETIVKHKLL